jgi:hypothetical protein
MVDLNKVSGLCTKLRKRLAPGYGPTLWAGPLAAPNFNSITPRILIMTVATDELSNTMLIFSNFPYLNRPRRWRFCPNTLFFWAVGLNH